FPDAEIRAVPGEEQHQQAATDHDPERKERDRHRRPVLYRKIGEPYFARSEAHASDEAAENGHAERVAVGLGRLVRPRDQYLPRRLPGVPAALDRRKLGPLLVVHAVANQAAEKEVQRT